MKGEKKTSDITTICSEKHYGHKVYYVSLGTYSYFESMASIVNMDKWEFHKLVSLKHSMILGPRIVYWEIEEAEQAAEIIDALYLAKMLRGV